MAETLALTALTLHADAAPIVEDAGPINSLHYSEPVEVGWGHVFGCVCVCVCVRIALAL